MKMRVTVLSTLTAAVLALGSTHDALGSKDGATLSRRETIADGTKLRILPLGDSITVGVQSSDENGYRGPLQQALSGSKLVFVGDLINGTMPNGRNAGMFLFLHFSLLPVVSSCPWDMRLKRFRHWATTCLIDGVCLPFSTKVTRPRPGE